MKTGTEQDSHGTQPARESSRSLSQHQGAKRRGARVGLVALAAILVAALVAGAAWFLCPLPVTKLQHYPASTHVVDREGNTLRIMLGDNDTRCDPVCVTDFGDWAPQALVAAEDKRFFQHPGIDAIAIFRALFQNMACRRVVSGASTLSTQVIRIMEPRRRTMPTKLVEALHALQMERKLSKNDILEQYLNRAPFGSNLAGIQAASRRYFGKDARDMTLAEAALLAGLPQAPSRFRPDRHLARALKRREYVLDRMTALGYISCRQRETAAAQPMHAAWRAAPFRAPHFCDLVMQTRNVASTNVRTTLDPAVQLLVANEVQRQMIKLNKMGVFSAAVVVIEVGSGSVRALTGAPDYDDVLHAGRVNCAAAKRSPGSALKPFAYAMAMERGLCTPGTVVGDVPIQFRQYQPKNFGARFSGLVNLRAALVRSLNIPALTVTRQVGLEDFVRILRRLGLQSLDKPAGHYGLSVVLGTAEVKLVNLVNAYACLARNGEYMPYRLLENDPIAKQSVRVFSRETAWLIADILGGDERALAVTGHAADVRLPRVAWKTGTSAGSRDAWTVAYNPEYVVGVWLGNADGTPAQGLVGIETAAPLAYSVFRRLYPDGDSPWYDRPRDIKTRHVCARSGCPRNPYCSAAVQDYYVAGISDPRPCSVHQVRPGKPGCNWEVREIWPAEINAFLRRTRAPGAQSNRQITHTAAPLKIISPCNGEQLKIVSHLPAASQALKLAAVAEAEENTLFWFVDDVLIGRCGADQSLFWPLQRGRHTVVCSDNTGRGDLVNIAVR